MSVIRAVLLGLAMVAAVATGRADGVPTNGVTTQVILVTNVVTVVVTNVVTNIVVVPVPVAAPTSEVVAAPKSSWDVSAAVGLTLTKGNSDTVLFTGNVLANQKKETYELSLGADAAYGENGGVENNNSYHGFGQYNQLFTKRIYAYGRVDALHDDIADVGYRLTLAPGAGYYFIKTDETLLSAEGGPGYVFERLDDHSDCYPTLRVAENFEHKVNAHFKLWEKAEYLPNLDYFAKYVVNAEVGIEAGLTKKASLRAYLDDTYDNKPAPGRKANDVKLVSALAYKF